MKRDEVLFGVKECVAEVLDVSPDTVGEAQRLVGDLSADPLDLLDLTFHLERRFKVKISPRDMEKRGREKLGNQPWEIDGVLTLEAIAELKNSMPEVPPDELQEGLLMDHIPRLFRVSTMVNLVSRLLEEKQADA